MVKARSPAASQFEASPRISTEPTERTMPKASASSGRMRPSGIGRLAVRVISASISASHHMLRQPEAPAPTAIIRREIAAITGFTVASETTMPTSAVKITSTITRGFSRAKKSDTSPPAAEVSDAVPASALRLFDKVVMGTV